jgi:hypothetical protein
MKLLGLLPIVSVAGLFALDAAGLVRPHGPTPISDVPNEIAAYLAVFAALFTVALFVFEVRGILMCNDLTATGRELEEKLGIPGQFDARAEKHRTGQYTARWQQFLARHLNARLAASTIYSLVFASWLFVALNYGFRVPYPWCVICASLSGLLLALGSYRITWLLVHPTDSSTAAISTVNASASTT